MPRAAAAIRLISDGDLGYTPSAPSFVTLAASVLGNAGADGDGFSEAIDPAMRSLDSDAGSVTSLDSDLAGASFVAGDVEAAQLAPLVADSQAFIDGNEQAISSLASDTGQEVAPPPAPPLPGEDGGDGPGSGPGGGGGSGGIGGGPGGGGPGGGGGGGGDLSGGDPDGGLFGGGGGDTGKDFANGPYIFDPGWGDPYWREDQIG
jgi:hypothetical protein